MATITSRRAIDDLIRDNGHYLDDPAVLRIVEYDTPDGETCWGVVYEGEAFHRYDLSTAFIHFPRVIFDHQLPCASCPK